MFEVHFFKSFWRTHVLFGGGHWFPCFGFLVTFQSHSGFCLISFFVEANVMYIPRDPALVLHMLTSCNVKSCDPDQPISQ